MRTRQGKFTINNGIGIASGIITSGLVGSATGKLEAALIGNAMAAAAELESKSKLVTRTQILLAPETAGFLSLEKQAEINVVRHTAGDKIEELHELICLYEN
jgi:class 3 adenylate cyclase